MTTPLQALVHFIQQHIRHERREHSPYAKGNFQFERVVTGWRATPILDLRLKK
jgi:hypothetical protein